MALKSNWVSGEALTAVELNKITAAVNDLVTVVEYTTDTGGVVNAAVPVGVKGCLLTAIGCGGGGGSGSYASGLSNRCGGGGGAGGNAM